mmetsp:Transcript_3084/g.7841  ORF Transcript_3084/g.7841 Transcript_3084/m.7841 type:complete len:98 (+) Transcript_3084:907-1200(+)
MQRLCDCPVQPDGGQLNSTTNHVKRHNRSRIADDQGSHVGERHAGNTLPVNCREHVPHKDAAVPCRCAPNNDLVDNALAAIDALHEEEPNTRFFAML